ncbi:MAG: DUF1501 domain-containing protein, partial [Planctomycetales bacterium]|nr:DUF1501 domain-containing protein [Planctomycetales bacterium]
MSYPVIPTSTPASLPRRAFLGRTASGIGATALAAMLSEAMGQRLLLGADAGAAAQSRGVVNPFHFAPKAKRVIILTMAGGPSHLET